MSILNRDVLYLIFEQIHDKNTLRLCLLVNRTWCEIVVPILWKNPWKCLKKRNRTLLLNVIISHLSEVSKNKIGEHNLFTNIYQNPSLNYISYCKHLNLDEIQKIINENIFEKSKLLIIQNEIFNIFINENMRFTHFYAHQKFDNQIDFAYESERCFSDIEYLSCSTSINDNIMSKLAETCRSIKQLEIFIGIENNNCGIIELIGVQKKLLKIDLTKNTYGNELFCKNLENSLIKHASTMQYCKICRQPSTNFLASFINLKELELVSMRIFIGWNFLENLSFPFLQILKSYGVPTVYLTSLIKNTRGSLIEIHMNYINHDEISNKKHIQAIYQNCPNIKYLKLLVRNCNILELETLLIRCRHLDGLYILISDIYDRTFFWDKLFEILSKSSSTSLFKFQFISNRLPKLKTFELFFDNWKGRHPMFLQIFSDLRIDLKMIERYKKEGIIKKFDYSSLWRIRNEYIIMYFSERNF